ncbi:MAG: alanine/glycine:cation symporter family protein [Planctomycetota bacterium]|nr:alanine/glycine:cation symporter family protein [Planctomycetota bacterium]MDA1114606.1 alanine/glycine:cation symporter family protein [Planctomycetota bacterium]
MKLQRLLYFLASLPFLATQGFAQDGEVAAEGGAFDFIDAGAGHLVGWLSYVFFAPMPIPFTGGEAVPLVVLWLVLGAIFFTVRMRFINLRGFRHAIDVTRGKYTDPNAHSDGEVTHFQALASALSATVGLGNIAGVAIAVATGGPGAIFWMVLAGFLGMSSKFVECTLGQKYREVRPNGQVMGGAMYYLSKGLKEKGMGGLGKVLATMFAILCIGGSLGGGNTFQVNQSLNAIKETVPFLNGHEWVFGLVMTTLVGIVIIGGIKRIASTAEKIVPSMCGIYVLACLFILGAHASEIGSAFALIFDNAINPDAAFGGFIGVLIIGFKRAAFSNEAGVGSAAIAHSAAKTEYPVREGIVALLEPFIDTIVVCTMTGLVIVITGAYDPSTLVGGEAVFAPYLTNANGAGLTSQAFGSVIWWFPYVLSAAVALFAFSTMISWSYYGERCWAYLFGDNSSMSYKVLFLTFTFLGSVINSQNVLEFGDLMILGMAFPNVLGVAILSGGVRQDLMAYWANLKAGKFATYK